MNDTLQAFEDRQIRALLDQYEQADELDQAVSDRIGELDASQLADVLWDAPGGDLLIGAVVELLAQGKPVPDALSAAAATMVDNQIERQILAERAKG